MLFFKIVSCNLVAIFNIRVLHRRLPNTRPWHWRSPLQILEGLVGRDFRPCMQPKTEAIAYNHSMPLSRLRSRRRAPLSELICFSVELFTRGRCLSSASAATVVASVDLNLEQLSHLQRQTDTHGPQTERHITPHRTRLSIHFYQPIDEFSTILTRSLALLFLSAAASTTRDSMIGTHAHWPVTT